MTKHNAEGVTMTKYKAKPKPPLTAAQKRRIAKSRVTMPQPVASESQSLRRKWDGQLIGSDW